MATLLPMFNYKLDFKLTGVKSYQQWDARIVMLFVATGMDEIVMCDENKTDRPLSHYKWHKCFDTRTIPSRKLQKCKDACEYVDDLLDMRRALREINGRMDDSELVRIVVCDVHMVIATNKDRRVLEIKEAIGMCKNIEHVTECISCDRRGDGQGHLREVFEVIARERVGDHVDTASTLAVSTWYEGRSTKGPVG
ncbi:hypothetical protein PInf_010101 [Phytophthora infestans]|nr:hypothetical protein PInf_010101 [Phytophthora infestans]